MLDVLLPKFLVNIRDPFGIQSKNLECIEYFQIIFLVAMHTSWKIFVDRILLDKI